MGPIDSSIAQPVALSDAQVASLRAAIRRGLRPLAVDPPITPSEWAERHFVLSAESSHGKQRWRPYAYQRIVVNIFGNEDIEQVAVMKSARVGYTKMLNIKMAWTAEHKRRNQAIWQPTDEDRDSFVKTEIDPMMRDCAALSRIALSSSVKNKANTLTQKHFVGSILHLLGAKAAKNFRRITISDAHIDELDGCDREVEKTSSPRALAWKRTEGAVFRKFIAGSTPLLKGLSLTEDFYEECRAKIDFVIDCEGCGAEHPLLWGGKDVSYGFKWDPLEPSKVRHHCPHCGHAITQADYRRQSARLYALSKCGTWRSYDGWRWFDAAGIEIKPPRTLGMHVWTAYSEQVEWPDIVEEFRKASAAADAGDKSKLKSFINETLGETWEDDEVDKMDQHELAKRADAYAPFTIPDGGLVLTCYADTQDGWWDVSWVAHGRDRERWFIGTEVIHGSALDEADWDRLVEVMSKPIRHASGAWLRPQAKGIDTQGHYAHQMYMLVRKFSHLGFVGTKGESIYGKPIRSRATVVEINYNGKVWKRGTKLWFIGTDTAKDLIFGQLQVPRPSKPGPVPGYIHFPAGLPDSFYEELTNEVRIPVRTARGEQSRWVKKKPHLRVEKLDGMVGNVFLAEYIGLEKYSSAMWDKLEAALQPDLFTLAASSAAHGDSADRADDDGAEPRIIEPGTSADRLRAIYGGQHKTSKGIL